MGNVKGSATLNAFVKTINPQLAKEILRKAAKNRWLSPSRITRYTQAIVRGEWVVAQPLAFDQNKRMLDGRHRLKAVIEANQPVEFLIVEGYDPDTVFGVFDGGGERKLQHWLQIQGEACPEVLAAVIVLAARDEAGIIPTTSGQGFTLTAIEGLEFLETHPKVRTSVNKGPGTSNVLASRALCCFAHYKFAEKNKAEADTFFKDLVVGHDEGPEDPVWLLRQRLENNRKVETKLKLGRTDVLALIFKAWNAQRIIDKGGDPKLGAGLRWTRVGAAAEDFPEPI